MKWMAGFGTIGLLLLLAGCDKMCGPKNYNDCVLEYLPKIQAQYAVLPVLEACKDKFSKTVPLKNAAV